MITRESKHISRDESGISARSILRHVTVAPVQLSFSGTHAKVWHFSPVLLNGQRGFVSQNLFCLFRRASYKSKTECRC